MALLYRFPRSLTSQNLGLERDSVWIQVVVSKALLLKDFDPSLKLFRALISCSSQGFMRTEFVASVYLFFHLIYFSAVFKDFFTDLAVKL